MTNAIREWFELVELNDIIAGGLIVIGIGSAALLMVGFR